MKKYTLLLFVIMFGLFALVRGSAWALFDAPLKSNLMLDLTASGGIKDLSLGQRFVQTFGDVTSKTDSGATDPYINFAGSGQVTTTLGWNANDSAPFTISLWVKAPTTARINNTPMMMDCANYES
ncbi:MAG: hypothetical protein ACOYN2_03870 [Patescibacteria group bacterium]